MKTSLASLFLCMTAAVALANTAPTPVVTSAIMRPGTTLMDVVFSVNDPDDATVKVRALAFIGGTRSFANVIKPVTFVEGTAVKLGDAIVTNTAHTLTWDVAADWSIDLGQLKFEILALDNRGLLAFDWITLPAAGGQPALTISKDTPVAAKVLDALFWEYAGGSPWVTLANGILWGNAQSGVFSGVMLASGSSPQSHAPAFIFKRMNLDPATAAEVNYAAVNARAGLLSTGSWHAVNRTYVEAPLLVGWGRNSNGSTVAQFGLKGTTAIAAGAYHSLALNSDGTVSVWGGYNSYGESTIPAGLSGVTAIAAGIYHNLALKSDGTVVAWGYNNNGQASVPAGLTGVTAIAAGHYHSLAIKADGTVVAWGNNANGQCTIPTGLIGVTVTRVAAGESHSLALKSDGTVVAWGGNNFGQGSIPGGLTGVTAIAAADRSSLALKSDGIVVQWGYTYNAIPAGLTGVTAIAAGRWFNLALKSDGTVVAWGDNNEGQASVPAGLNGVTAIAAGLSHSLALKSVP